jgi:MFS family permease
MLMFNGGVVPFLAVVWIDVRPQRAERRLLYSIRAIASTLARIPASNLAARFSNRNLLLAAVVLEAVAALGIGLAPNAAFVVAFAVADGIAFGTFLGTSQSFIAESVPASGIGTWLGVYSATGALGETTGGVVMGTIAAAFGGPWRLPRERRHPRRGCGDQRRDPPV